VILANSTLLAQNKALLARIAELEAKHGKPPKTPDNSSLPPSRGQKGNVAEPTRVEPAPPFEHTTTKSVPTHLYRPLCQPTNQSIACSVRQKTRVPPVATPS
jgi:hypothetical protein